MHLSLEGLDLFFRSATIGQIVLLGGVHLRVPLAARQLSLLSVALCMIAYLLLTAPLDDAQYGLWRNVLLIFTDALAYAIWFAALYAFDDEFAPGKWPPPVKIGGALFVVWHIYFFGVLEGSGVYHGINHVLGIILLTHVLYVALRGLRDDLIDARRRTRILAAVLISGYVIVLALVQLFGANVRDASSFNLANASASFVAVFLLGRYILIRPIQGERDLRAATERITRLQGHPAPAELTALDEKLDAFMRQGGYRQSGLTIAELASQLSYPEHRVRRLINGVLGFRNFSAFLNEHRVRDACEQLADPAQGAKPVLTIALELGYGSIGPFNRAFKAQTGLTPTEYRDSVQNRR